MAGLERCLTIRVSTTRLVTLARDEPEDVLVAFCGHDDSVIDGWTVVA